MLAIVLILAMSILPKIPSQAASLVEGERYYFDLSMVKDQLFKVSDKLPVEELTYVPFTYVGSVKSYNFEDYLGRKDGVSLSDRTLFVSDYNIGLLNSWDELNESGLMYGKSLQKGFTLRSMTGGDTAADNQSEWQAIATKNSSYIKNTTGEFSWCQDYAHNEIALKKYRTTRGFHDVMTVSKADSQNANSQLGYRPVVQTDGSQLQVVCLVLNEGTLAGAKEDIRMAYTGKTYTAPSQTGLDRPTSAGSDSYFVWNTQADGKGYNYKVGMNVPSEYKTLYAQWVAVKGALEPPVIESDSSESDSSESSSSEGNKSSDQYGGADTGDHTPIGVWVAVMTGAALLMFTIWKKCSYDKRKRANTKYIRRGGE